MRLRGGRGEVTGAVILLPLVVTMVFLVIHAALVYAAWASLTSFSAAVTLACAAEVPPLLLLEHAAMKTAAMASAVMTRR